MCRGTSAGAARALQGQAPLSWPITTQAMNCDQTTLNTHPQAAAESGPDWFTPGLLLSVCIRPEDSSEALGGTGSCFGGCWWQFLVPIPGAVASVPWPCLVQASGRLRSCVIWWASRKLDFCLCRFLIQPIKFSAQAEDDFRVKQNACQRAIRASKRPGTCSPHHPMASLPSSPQDISLSAEEDTAGMVPRVPVVTSNATSGQPFPRPPSYPQAGDATEAP